MIQLKIVNLKPVKPGDIIMLKVRDVYQKSPGRFEWSVEILDLMVVKAELDQEDKK